MATNDSNSRTIEIQLTKGYVAIVDEQDADLATRKWQAIAGYDNNYAYSSIYKDGKATAYLMHRIILGRILGREVGAKEICDHINGNGIDNRRSNLRLATHAENMRNAKKRKSSSNPYKGIRRNKNRWRATITVDGKDIHLGAFLTPEEAYDAYCEGARKYHGEFARFD